MDDNKLVEILNKSNNFDEFKENILNEIKTQNKASHSPDKEKDKIEIKDDKYYFSYSSSYIYSERREYSIEFYNLKSEYKKYIHDRDLYSRDPSFKNGEYYFYNNNFYYLKEDRYKKENRIITEKDLNKINIPFKTEDFSNKNWLDTLKKMTTLYPYEKNSIDDLYFPFGEEYLLKFSFNNSFEKVKEKDLTGIWLLEKKDLSIEEILQGHIISIFLWHKGEQTDPIWIKYIKENIIPEISYTK